MLRWNDKQSEYCQKKAHKKHEKSDTIPTVSGHCPPRGEEKRREEIEEKEKKDQVASATGAPVTDVAMVRPTVEEIEEECERIGLPIGEGSQFFHHFESNGWKVGGKAPMKKWKSALATWKHRKQSDQRMRVSPPAFVSHIPDATYEG